MLCSFIFQTAEAQTNNSISGKLHEEAMPLEFVTVLLFKQSDTLKVIKKSTSDSTGYFTFKNVENGNYRIRFSLLGYETMIKNVTLNNLENKIVLDTLLMTNTASKLQGVTITSQKKIIEKTNEGFVVNASATLTQAGGTVIDILKNTPTISVDAEDGITMRGKAPMILINGKNSAIKNLNQIPASSIESIEIVNSASAKYDANAQSGIINIRLKKNKQKGVNGAVALGLGYGAKPRANGSFLINKKTDKWNFGLGYDNRFAGRTKKITGGRTNFSNTDVNQINQLRMDERFEQAQNLKLNIDYMPNAKNTFSFEAIGNTEGQDNLEDLTTTIYKSNQVFNSSNNRYSKEIERSKVAELALDYQRQFDDERKSLTASITSSFNFDRQNTPITTQELNESGATISSQIYNRTHNYENENITNVKLDYAFPIFKKAIVETGYKAIYRTTNDDYESALQVNTDYVKDTLASNIFKFNETVQAAYVLLNSPIGKGENPTWKYSIGVRAEQVFNKGNTQNYSSQFTNQYLKFFPTASLSFQQSESFNWKLSYGKRIKRPDLDQLNPFTDITDSLNPHSGNPYLQPEIIHAFEINNDKSWKNASLSNTIYYRYSINTINRFLQLQPNGVSLILPVNIGNSVTYGFESVFTDKVNTWYDFNASVSLFHQHIDANNKAVDLIQNAVGYYGKMLNNFSINKKMKLQIIGNYNSSLATVQGKRLEQYSIDMGFQQKLGKGNSRFSITLVDMFNTLKSGYLGNTADFSSYRNIKADTRAVMLTFAHSFKTAFKEHLLENQFSKEY